MEHQTATDGGGCRRSYTAGVSKTVQLLCKGCLAVSYCIGKLDIYSYTTPDILSRWLFLSQSPKTGNSPVSYHVLFAEPAVPTRELSGRRMPWVGLVFPRAHCPLGHRLRFPGRAKAVLSAPARARELRVGWCFPSSWATQTKPSL